LDAVEYEWGSQVSLIVFLAPYFLFLWIAWVLAVGVTKPNQSSRYRLDLTAQIRSALGRLGRFASKSGPASPRGFLYRALTRSAGNDGASVNRPNRHTKSLGGSKPAGVFFG